MDQLTAKHISAASEAVATLYMKSLRVEVGMQRGFDILNRITSNYKPEDSLPAEVVDYIQDYEEVCAIIGLESIEIKPGVESAWDVVKNIVRSLWNMLCKIWDSIKNCFRWIFNAQYRASKSAVSYRQEIALLCASRENSEKFEQFVVNDIITPEDMKKYMNATSELIRVLENIPAHNTEETVDSYVNEALPKCGIVFKNEQYFDTYKEIPYKAGTYGSLGWTAKMADTYAKDFIELTRRTVNLKRLESDLDKDVAELKRKQNALIASGADISEVQKVLIYKLKMYKTVHAGQVVLMDRIDNLTALFERIASDAHDVANGIYDRVGYDNDDD